MIYLFFCPCACPTFINPLAQVGLLAPAWAVYTWSLWNVCAQYARYLFIFLIFNEWLSKQWTSCCFLVLNDAAKLFQSTLTCKMKVHRPQERLYFLIYPKHHIWRFELFDRAEFIAHTSCATLLLWQSSQLLQEVLSFLINILKVVMGVCCSWKVEAVL